MAGQQRRMEGSEEQKQAAAREARDQGKLPSEVRATTGASKQRQEAPSNASHQEKMDRKHEGKRGGTQSSEQHEQPRPGNRDEDPRRDPSRYE